MINTAYKDYSYCADYPWHLEIEIAIQDKTEAGLPTDAEGGVLNSVEDQLEAELRKAGAVHFIARQTWNGRRMLDYYVCKPFFKHV